MNNFIIGALIGTVSALASAAAGVWIGRLLYNRKKPPADIPQWYFEDEIDARPPGHEMCRCSTPRIVEVYDSATWTGR